MSPSDPHSPADPALAKKKKLAKKMLRKKIVTLDQSIKASLADSQYAKNKKIRTQQQQKLAMWGGGALILIALIYVLFMQGKGSLQYGLCKVFIETRVEYPVELRFTSVQTYPNKVRVWYVPHDSFGQKAIEKMDCYFGYDQNRQIYMKKAEINRGEIDPRDIARFNASIPAILAYPPDLKYPKGLPSGLRDFQKMNK